ncbi:MAG: hypothetical protein HYY25_03265 [Candidatus Wallbacteria bacterium]|nr:hypothetical protein [Candidatus Wallbacteria bacterium]
MRELRRSLVALVAGWVLSTAIVGAEEAPDFEDLMAAEPVAAVAQPERRPSRERQEALAAEFGLLSRAIQTSIRALRKAGESSGGDHYFSPSYQPYETRRDEQGRLQLVGATLHSTGKRPTDGHGNHDFAFRYGLAEQFRAPLPYLSALGRRSELSFARLVRLYERELRALAGLHVRGQERQWSKLVLSAWKAILRADARLTALGELARAGQRLSDLPAAPAGTDAKLRELIELARLALGVNESDGSIDRARARSAFDLSEEGSALTGRPYEYRLKPELKARVERILSAFPRGSSGSIHPMEEVARVAMRPLLAPVKVYPALALLSNQESRATQTLVIGVFHLSQQLQALASFIDATPLDAAD